MNVVGLLERLRQVRGELADRGQQEMADRVLQAISDLERARESSGDPQQDCLGR